MRPQPFDSRQPALPSVQKGIQVAFPMAETDIRNRCGVASTHLWIARLSAARNGRLEPGARPLTDQCALKFGKRAEHLGHEHALRA